VKRRERNKKLVGPWRSLHGAVWLIGLAILLWRGWMWPGILVLVAISMLIEALLMQFAPQAFAEVEPEASEPSVPPPAPVTDATPEHPAELLPSACPKCGAPVRGSEVKWTGPQSADCPYCGANLPVRKA
jgi:hypothetical protein